MNDGEMWLLFGGKPSSSDLNDFLSFLGESPIGLGVLD
jgi:hypothetical protein